VSAGVLGLFNLQGAWWDRSVRNFATLQDGRVPTVKALVKASDVEGLVSEVGRCVCVCVYVCVCVCVRVCVKVSDVYVYGHVCACTHENTDVQLRAAASAEN